MARHPACETSNPWVFPTNSPVSLTPKLLGPAPLTPDTGVVPQLLDYAGAVGRLDIAKVPELGARFVVQPKHDGQYVHVHLDGRGRVERILSRSGQAVQRQLVSHMLGAFAGWPGAVLAGELEAHTERGNAAASRGYRLVHLFDCIRAENGRYMGREPYRARRDALLRMQSEVVNLAPRLPWDRENGLRGRSGASGRYCRAVPTDWRLFPVTEQLPVARAGELWDRAIGGEAEGLVVVALDAPLGRRGSKRKVKPVETLDAVVEQVDRSGYILRVRGSREVFAVGPRQDLDVSVGSVVEVAHEGWYDTGVPRFARVLRERMDLV